MDVKGEGPVVLVPRKRRGEWYIVDTITAPSFFDKPFDLLCKGGARYAWTLVQLLEGAQWIGRDQSRKEVYRFFVGEKDSFGIWRKHIWVLIDRFHFESISIGALITSVAMLIRFVRTVLRLIGHLRRIHLS
ncbi:hypothetical protein NA8A_04105 [Nitratireductor indicus C115]|uniref:Uncharacterized protein n=1 Tax=Nitratireductor indicus C115 TaxID=1231190 RepID=K2N8Y8_9HYPH|nr:hypothetical protein NA8A_04105 [Nitratireductor indicus C115]